MEETVERRRVLCCGCEENPQRTNQRCQRRVVFVEGDKGGVGAGRRTGTLHDIRGCKNDESEDPQRGRRSPGKCEQTCFVNQNRTEPRPTHPILDPIVDPIFKKAFCAKIGC